MSKTIAVCNQKGGVGKTTTTVNLAVYLTTKFATTLVVDSDPQGNATSALGFEKNPNKHSVYEMLVGELPAEAVVSKTDIDWLELIPSNINLIGAEVELVNELARETKLKQALALIKNSYDYIFVDCPPSLGLLTINALTAADSILIPIQCEYYAMEGLTQLMKTIHLVRQALNPKLELEGIVLTMFDSRLNLSQQVADEVRKFFGNKVYKTIIPRNIRLAEAPSFGKPVMLYDKHSKGAQAYLTLAEEFLERNVV
ncbi:MAG: ParA family protein [Elusimicrobiota bacterium]|nr:ParA family protein [Elusimicrobiota bacterium]